MVNHNIYVLKIFKVLFTTGTIRLSDLFLVTSRYVKFSVCRFIEKSVGSKSTVKYYVNDNLAREWVSCPPPIDPPTPVHFIRIDAKIGHKELYITNELVRTLQPPNPIQYINFENVHLTVVFCL